MSKWIRIEVNGAILRVNVQQQCGLLIWSQFVKGW